MLKLEKLRDINAIPGKSSSIAVVDGSVRLTWADLEVRGAALAAYLAPKRHRRAVFLSANRAEIIPLMSAFSTLGVPFAGIDYTGTYEQKLHCAREVSADCLVYSEPFRPDAEALAADLGLESLCIDTDLQRLDGCELVELAPGNRPFESISFTSGTSGMPRATHRTVSFDTRRFADLTRRFGFTERDVFVAALPFFHVSVNGWARLFLSLGGKLVLADVADPVRILQEVAEHGGTAMLSTPPVLEGFVEAAARTSVPASLRFVVVGGKAFLPEMKRRAFQVLGPIVNEYYGTTETGVNVIGTAEDLAAFPESAGRVMEGNDVVIVDPLGVPVPNGTIGRIAIDSYQLMDRYLGGRPSDCLQLGHRRFFMTSDCGYLQGDRLFLSSRSFSVTSAVNLYAIEDGVRTAPGVEDAFAIVANPQEIRLFVAKDRSADEEPVRERVRSMAHHHPGYELRVEFVPRIPYSMSGKVRVNDLLEPVYS